jgi:predicted MFS family arabinose efflux permease
MPIVLSVFTPQLRRAFAVNFFSDLSFALLVHFPGFLKQLGAREALIGTVAAVAGLAAVTVRPWVSQEMDRRGRRPLILAAGAIRLVVAPLYLTIDSMDAWTFVVRSAYIVAVAVSFTGIFTYAGDVAPPMRRTQALALFGLSGMIPGMFGAALGDLIIDRAGFSTLFMVVVGLDAMTLLAATRLDPAVGRSAAHEQVGFRRVITVRALVPVWVMIGVFGAVFGSIQTFLRTFVDTTQIGSVGLFFFAYSTTAVVLRLSLSHLPDRVGYRRVLYPAIAFQALGMVMLATTDRLADLVLGGILAGTGHAFMFPILSRLVVERAPAADRGSAMGFFTALFDIAILVGGPVLGVVIENFGYPAMFFILAGLVTVGAFGFHRLDPRPTDDIIARQSA